MQGQLSTHDTVISGARVVTPAGAAQCDIGIRDGRIVTLGTDLSGDEMIDATGLIAMPGGIDSHVHIAQPSGPGIEMADDFASATRAAACGGNTLVMPFVLPDEDQSLREATVAYLARAEGQCLTDISCHLIVKSADPVTLGQDLPALIAQGLTSFKVFMTYEGMRLKDSEILQVMDVAKAQGALTLVHAENEDAIEFLRDKAERAGDTAPVFHARSRPVPVEREATHRATTLAEVAGVPLMVVHVSNGAALEEIRRAKGRGVKVYAETCPQYITLTADDLDRAGFEGAKWVCSPPPRDTQEQAAIWAGLEQGAFDVFSSDHCPFRFADEKGKDAPGARVSFRNIPNGIPGVETRLPILFSEGVSKGRISLEAFAALTATNHARIYGLTNKGALMVGKDADIVLWDPTLTKAITQGDLHHGSDYTPWEGFAVTGWPVRTLLRGQTVMENGAPVGAAIGRHIARDKVAA
ncbi:dihydropyrimidinase [Marinovum sp. 2_MG-2023]|uniref:dihydropyrimidinase n=1 Tax=unclassified Marinovum TaxID=2647166 RepID=UPI0026E121F4|nr:MULTISPECIES: dihydropyrimidinase [unclassified Marinovum]MDO6732673.1 dihydropyrimidinase [Marinovum sp. 2_MG-2023]MDO6781946.1 dihydropyrimidinase [Marinovum sp. 1_MG-2023]